MNLDGEALYRWWTSSNMGKREFWRYFLQNDMTYSAFHGLTWRYASTMGLPPNPKSFEVDLGQALRIKSDKCIVVGDVQLPTTDYYFAQLVGAIAQEYGVDLLIIAGDLFNLDGFTTYEKITSLPGLHQELNAARQLLGEWLTMFKRIIILPGNHERRITRRTQGEIMLKELIDMTLRSDKIETTNWGHVILETSTGEWRVTHGSNYSINQLVVAEKLAHKFGQNIISHHEHHCAKGWDRYKRYVLINNGGLFDTDKMAYVSLDDSASAGMMKGFTFFNRGYPYVLSEEPYTDWDAWLGEVSAVDEAA